MPLSLPEFVQRWKASTLTERAAAQSHFIDLCEVLHQPHPAAADQTGDSYTFEKHVSRLKGGKGFADVWKRGFFAWEYKGKHKDLKAAYLQLNDYREDLENPPLLVTCDQDRFQIHTNFTNTRPQVYSFTLDELDSSLPTPNCALSPLDVLKAVSRLGQGTQEHRCVMPRADFDTPRWFALMPSLSLGRLEVSRRILRW